MAPTKKTPLSSPIPIGNCEVIVEANKFTCKSDPSSLQISVPRNGKVRISVREEIHMKSGKDIWHSKSEENGDEERVSTSGDEYMFVLVNPKDADNCSKSYIQDVLNMYIKELPTMNYAANTGKQSTFLERCVSNGKYCTLLLKSNSMGGSEAVIPYTSHHRWQTSCTREVCNFLQNIIGSWQVIAAITYQIIPADTQYAEIPLAAVRSIYQNKGFGGFLFKEFSKRLQSVGIRTIFCWGDKESEGFWLKQGFTTIAEVGTKGRARRLPIKADIQRALCFPGGSSLMLSHLNRDTSVKPADLLKFSFHLKRKLSSSASDKSLEPGSGGEHDNTLKSLNQTISRTESFRPEGLVKDGFSRENTKLGGFSGGQDSLYNHSCCHPATFEEVECNMDNDAAKILADTDGKDCSYSTQGAKRRVWEASLSSLKSKKVKGIHQNDCQLESNCGLVSENEGKQFKNKFFVEVSTADPLFISCRENNSEESRPVGMTSESLVRKELQSNGECFRIMLMNIADETKKAHLTKVIENLGGFVTSDGSVSTHVVTAKVRKTLNFCTALCSGAWIVSPSWLKESCREGRFVDESSYLSNDEDYLLKYRTELKNAVLRAKARPQALLKGYNIRIAAHVQPAVATLSAIVRSAGGNIIRGLDKLNEASETIFIAGEEDMEEALSAIKKGIRTFSSDWLMSCVMKQELDLEAPQFAESL